MTKGFRKQTASELSWTGVKGQTLPFPFLEKEALLGLFFVFFTVALCP